MNYTPRVNVNVQKSGFLERIASGFVFVLESPFVAYDFLKALMKEDIANAEQYDKSKRLTMRHNLW